MQKIEIKTLFEVGAEVIEEGNDRRGKVAKVWVKPLKVNENTFNFEVSYSIVREGAYNNFRSSEERLREIVYDEKGAALILPKGMSSKD